MRSRSERSAHLARYLAAREEFDAYTERRAEDNANGHPVGEVGRVVVHGQDRTEIGRRAVTEYPDILTRFSDRKTRLGPGVSRCRPECPEIDRFPISTPECQLSRYRSGRLWCAV